jgi:hypothetical protein
MRALGCSVAQIAAEMGRRFNLRPRLAWRHALGWSQWKLTQRYNTVHPGARLWDNRVSEFENWPYGGSPPTLRYLAQLAATFGHGCTPAQLVDADDLEHLSPADRRRRRTRPARADRPARHDVSSLLGARDDVFALIAGRQQPRHTTGLYKIAGQMCGLLALATLDLGYPRAADTHARTALHCALAPVLRSTQAEYRTVPVIGRSQSLHTLLAQRPDLASGTLTALRDDLAEFCTHPAPTPAGLEPDSPDPS